MDNLTLSRAGGLVTEFTFDSVSGTTVKDSAEGYDGAANNLSYTSGLIGNAAIFNGSNTRLITSAPYTDDTLRAISAIIEFPVSRPSRGVVFAAGKNTSCYAWFYVVAGTAYDLGILYASSNGGTYKGVSLPYSLVSGQRAHIAINLCGRAGSASDINVYINGTVATTTALTQTGTVLSPYGGNSAIGCAWTTISPYYEDFWSGRMDQFRIWSHRLTSEEILALYNNGQGC